jgi:hypothetical protein
MALHFGMLGPMKRTRYNAMQPAPTTTWLVVEDIYRKPLHVRELAPGTDPRMVMIEAMSKSIREGFEVEELPGTMPLYYCRKGDERRMVFISHRKPGESHLKP